MAFYSQILVPLLYNILPINGIFGIITTKCHSESMDDNRDSTVLLHQEISSLPVSIASDTRCFQIFPIIMNMLECY